MLKNTNIFENPSSIDNSISQYDMAERYALAELAEYQHKSSGNLTRIEEIMYFPTQV